jgi:ferredoxin
MASNMFVYFFSDPAGGQDKDRDQDQDRDQARERRQDRGQHPDQDQNRDQDPDQDPDQDQDRGQDLDLDQDPEQHQAWCAQSVCGRCLFSCKNCVPGLFHMSILEKVRIHRILLYMACGTCRKKCALKNHAFGRYSDLQIPHGSPHW